MQPSRIYALVLSAISTLMLGSTYRPPERGFWLAGIASSAESRQISVPVIPAARPVAVPIADEEPLRGMARVVDTMYKEPNATFHQRFCGLLGFNTGDQRCSFKRQVVPGESVTKTFNVVKSGAADSYDIVFGQVYRDGVYLFRTNTRGALITAVYGDEAQGPRTVGNAQVAQRFQDEVGFWRTQERQVSASLMSSQ